jgi:hypothetical protein
MDFDIYNANSININILPCLWTNLTKKQMETPHNFTFQSSAAAVVFGVHLSAWFGFTGTILPCR